MYERNDDAEECMECGSVPHHLCEECGCCSRCCECDEEREEVEEDG